MANLRKLGVAMLVYSVPQYVAEDKHRGYNTTHLIKVPQSHHRCKHSIKYDCQFDLVVYNFAPPI